MKKVLVAVVLWVACAGVAGAQDFAAGSASVSQDTAKPVAYVGAGYDFMTLSVNRSDASGGIPQGHYDGRLIDFRAGFRLMKAVSVEAHVGVNASGSSGRHFGFTRYYALFAVPTAVVFNTVELSVPVGYVWSGVRADGARATFNSVAFGANLELPIRVLYPGLPDVRVTGGGIVSIQRSNAQIYGFHLGLRYDFGLGGLKDVGTYFGF